MCQRRLDGEFNFAMYRCSVELSVQYDGQSQRESEHASLIDKHAHLNSVANRFDLCFDLNARICSSISI